MKRQVKYGNSVIQYDLIKTKRRKTSQITVTLDGVTVRTPQTKSTVDVKNMIEQRLQWIFKKQLEFKDRKKQRTKQFKIIHRDSYLEKRVKTLALKIGVKPSKIIIKPLKGRWGSATGKKVITLNSSLLKAPKNVIDYVIIHELCHLKIKEHSPRFWNLIGKHMPKYQESVKWLEVNGIRIN